MQDMKPVVKLLLEGGADVNAVNNRGYSALAVARKNGREDIARMLEEAGGIAIAPEEKQLRILPTPRATNNTPPIPLVVNKRPVPLTRPRPMYTEEARRSKVSGIVRIKLLVGDDGQVKQAIIVRGLPDGLSQEARRCAYGIRFEPAMRNGKPVEFWTPVDIEFNVK